MAYKKECEKVGLDPKDIDRLRKRLERWIKDANRMGVTLFGGSSISLRFEGDRDADDRPLILSDVWGHVEGGDGSYSEAPDGYVRGEGDR